MLASGIELALALRGMGSVTVRDHMTTDPIVDTVGCLSRGGDCRHGRASLLRCRAAHPASRSAPDYLMRGPSVGFPTKVCLSPSENPARIPIGRGLGNPLICWGAGGRGLYFGKLVGTRKVPHGTSGTNSPYGIRSWKCRITAVSVLGIEIASASPGALPQRDLARGHTSKHTR